MEKIKKQKLMRKQISKKLRIFKDLLPETSGIRSWSAYLRQGLGISVTQLAARLGTTQSTVSGLEKREEIGNITLKKLRELADSMECDLLYAFVPRSSIEKIVEKQAKKKALESMKSSDSHMALENQKVDTDFEERLQDLIEEQKYSKYLWDINE